MGKASSDLAALKNLGPTSVQWLNEAGLFTRADLEELGAVLAYRIVMHQRPDANLNLLYALHGALTDTHWAELPPAMKARLKQEAAAPLHVCPSYPSLSPYHPVTDLPPFPGFREEAFDFMSALAANNRRDWFKPRKETFDDEVMWPMQCLMADAAREAGRLGLPFTADPKRSIFRLYRDTRFSKNKQPYKTHVGAVFSRSGERNEEGVLYVHFEPGNSFLGAGFWHPEMPLLRAWRSRLAASPADFLAIIRDLEAKGLVPETTDALKRLPRGFEAPDDPKVAEMLRWKSFLVSRTFDDEALQSPAFTEAVVAMMRDTRPLLEYGWSLKPANVS